MRTLASMALVASLAAGCAGARSPMFAHSAAIERGHAFVGRACVGCHAINRADESRNAHAPRFRDLAHSHTDAELAAAVAEVSRNGHVAMPPIYVTPDERRDVVAYMRSLTGRST